MQTTQINSLNKQEDNRHFQLLWLATQLNAQVSQFDCEVDSGAGCNIISLYIYRSLSGDKKLEPPTVFIDGYDDSPVKKQGSCTVVLLTGCQVSQKEVFRVTDTRGYLILCCETAQQLGYIHFSKITSPKLTQLAQDWCSPEGYNRKNTKVQGDKQDGSRCETPKWPTVWWCSTHQRKEIQPTLYQRIDIEEVQWFLQLNRDTTEGEYHIKLKKDYKPVQHPPRSVPVKFKPAYKELQ